MRAQQLFFGILFFGYGLAIVVLVLATVVGFAHGDFVGGVICAFSAVLVFSGASHVWREEMR